MKFCFYLLLASLSQLTALKQTHAGSIVLNWNPSASPLVAGYNVYFGTNSGNYAYKIQVGNAQVITISNLILGATYYFAATAYDAAGHESAYSAEIKANVAVSLSLFRSAEPRAPVWLQFPVEPGHWYEIQAATNCTDWNWIWRSGVLSSNGVMQLPDRDWRSFRSRFYRLISH